jgi:hypothetical protein
MFEHPYFDVYRFDAIPLDRDCFLMDVAYIEDYEKSLLSVFSGGDYEPIGYISYAAVRRINDTSLEVSWYPVLDRFHEVVITLPQTEFVTCVGSWRWDEKPHIFVKSTWLENLYLRRHSVFGLVDAIGVKEAIQKGTLTRERLLVLREEIDKLGKSYPQISFISFADSVLIKSNWSVGHVKSNVRYTYQPEIFITTVKELRSLFWRILGLSVYAVLTQGTNEYYEDSLLHISESKNHVCLNSLGLPFADLMAIDEAARLHIREKVHEPSDLYIDEHFYHSLKFTFMHQKFGAIKKYSYTGKIRGALGYYYAAQLPEILGNLE